MRTREAIRIGPKTTTARNKRYLTLEEYERQVSRGLLTVIDAETDPKTGALKKVFVESARYVESDTALLQRVLGRDIGGKKNILVLNDEAEAKLAEQYRLQGVVRTGFDGMEVERVGGKFNLTDVAARVGLGQLPHLEEFTARRRALARAYLDQFEAAGVRKLGLGLPVADFENGNWHMFQVVRPEERLTIQRAEVMAQLQAAAIGTGVHYPAIHLFALYRRMGWKEGDFPHAEYAGRNILSLPLFPAMLDADVSRVVSTLAGILQTHLKP